MKLKISEKKFFIGYVDKYKIKPFTIILSKTSAYIKRW